MHPSTEAGRGCPVPTRGRALDPESFFPFPLAPVPREGRSFCPPGQSWDPATGEHCCLRRHGLWGTDAAAQSQRSWGTKALPLHMEMPQPSA